MKRVLQILILLLSTNTFSQNITTDWTTLEQFNAVDEFTGCKMVHSNTNPFLVTTFRQTYGGGPGGSGPTVDDFISVYDTSGSLQWVQYLAGGKPHEIISFEQNKYWIVASGPTGFELNGTTIPSPYPFSTHRTLYFVESNYNGNVLNSFTYSYSDSVNMFINAITVDQYDYFLVAGRIKPDQFYDYDFTFAGETVTLKPEEEQLFIARFNQYGNELDFYTIKGTAYSNGHNSSLTDVAVGEDGKIMFVGAIGDTLVFEDTTIVNSLSDDQMFIGYLDNNFDEQEVKYNYVCPDYISGYGLKYNPENNLYYVWGRWTDELHLGQTTPISGNTSPWRNYFIARFDNTSLIDLQTIIPDINYFYIKDLLFDGYGDLHITGYTSDSLVHIGNNSYSINNGNTGFDWEGFYLTMTKELQPKTFNYSDDDGLLDFIGIAYDTINENTYLAGRFNGTIEFANETATAWYGNLDGILIKVDDDALVSTGVENHELSNISVYPQPCNHELFIDTRDSDIEQFIIYDISGKIVQCSSVSSGNSQTRINTAALNNGMYVLEISSGQNKPVRFTINVAH